MKLSIATLVGLAGAISAASLPSAFTLVADGGLTVQTDGENAWIGANTTTHEVLILHSAPNGMVTFTSQSETPTGWQNLYIVENSVQPIALTTPHSGTVPEGASMTGFGVNDKGYFTHGGKDWFAVDGYGESKAKEIFWYGAHNAEYNGVSLWVKECKGC